MLSVTTTHLDGRRRGIAAIAAIFVASASVGTAAAATAFAEPDGSEVAYVNCMLQYRQYHPGATTEEVLFDCFITVGGIWSNPDD